MSKQIAVIHLGDTLEKVEQILIEKTLQHVETKRQAARILGINEKTLYYKIKIFEANERSGKLPD